MKEWLSAAAFMGGIIIAGLAAVLLNVAVVKALGAFSAATHNLHIGRLFQ